MSSFEPVNPPHRRPYFDALVDKTKSLEPARVALVHPVEELSLRGALEAFRRGLIIPLLVGPAHKIRAAAEKIGADLAGIKIIDVPHSHAAAAKGVELAREGEVEALMKGALHTDELIKPFIQEASLKTGRRISHVWAADVPDFPRLLLMTDCAINIQPDLTAKKDIAQNALDLAEALGVEQPKMAVLSATEEVNPAIPATIDAAALCKMADRGQITGGLLDGPLAFDNAVSPEAAAAKNIDSKVAGRADILLAPDLEAGNMMGKQLRYLAQAELAGLVLGARLPVILTSRADGVAARVTSCALALLAVERRRRRLGLVS